MLGILPEQVHWITHEMAEFGTCMQDGKCMQDGSHACWLQKLNNTDCGVPETFASDINMKALPLTAKMPLAAWVHHYNPENKCQSWSIDIRTHLPQKNSNLLPQWEEWWWPLFQTVKPHIIFIRMAILSTLITMWQFSETLHNTAMCSSGQACNSSAWQCSPTYKSINSVAALQQFKFR